MTSERGLWGSLRKHLSPFGKLERIENAAGIGTPDVAYCLRHPTADGVTPARSGWLELKELDAWPKRPLTPIRIPKLKLEQVLWLESWDRAGGAAHALLQVERAYFLLPPRTVRAIWDRQVTRAEINLFWLDARGESGSFPTRSLLKCLVR